MPQLEAENQLMKRVRKTRSCWLWEGSRDLKGYGHLHINGKRYSAHRAAYMIFIGPIPKGRLVCHHCDTPNCVRPSHLYAGTYKTNRQDAVRRGRTTKGDAHWTRHHKEKLRGEHNNASVLKNNQVLEIRRLYKTGLLTYRGLARRFNIHQVTVWHILTRRTWAHLKAQELTER